MKAPETPGRTALPDEGTGRTGSPDSVGEQGRFELKARAPESERDQARRQINELRVLTNQNRELFDVPPEEPKPEPAEQFIGPFPVCPPLPPSPSSAARCGGGRGASA